MKDRRCSEGERKIGEKIRPWVGSNHQPFG